MTDSTNAKLRERVADWHKARLAILSAQKITPEQFNALADAETNLSRLAAMIQEAGERGEDC